MKARNILVGLAAASMATASVAAHAASALSIRAAAPMVGASYLQAEDDDDDDDGSTAVILGVVLIVLIGAAAISGNSGSGPSNSP